ncbi:tRNA (adenosine(37)-N6)-threonylcarbamoyltransferase complex transferase subunit TsaD [Thermus filiformis]|uniref:tRNA N6-adenosine threonylcarbamoyltransferase n=1 Tax=Thermus filiformis TaxID=276 RepID=A0A0A2WNK6_THEFI|nr:tRNA (adenosine(37)-N6)-threonylcarbamoyltransferase complex transferase subunit TsaD [Thermus filiformis]KGQ21408.2 O-sialoglycoprotein endopeptidase [Thermus filiformis]
MWVLGIDTSCDDTGVGLVKDGQVVVNLIRSQVALHQAYGGVVPELASREHLKAIRPLAERALAEAGLSPAGLDLVAATRGPGLIGALLVGFTFAKGLAFALDRPFLGIHHLEAHIVAAWPEGLDPPFLALVASGGHTHLFEVLDLGRYRLLGATLDDAAGEAFDKVARLLGLGFPGGPEIERLAEEAEEEAPFAVPLRGQKGLDFSFSGLKTRAVQLLEKGYSKPAIARGFQKAAVAHLQEVLLEAVRRTGHRTLLVAGGVAANRALRAGLEGAGLRVYFPPKGLSQDNGAMVALAAYRRFLKGEPPHPLSLDARAYWPLEEVSHLAGVE